MRHESEKRDPEGRGEEEGREIGRHRERNGERCERRASGRAAGGRGAERKDRRASRTTGAVAARIFHILAIVIVVVPLLGPHGRTRTPPDTFKAKDIRAHPQYTRE